MMLQPFCKKNYSSWYWMRFASALRPRASKKAAHANDQAGRGTSERTSRTYGYMPDGKLWAGTAQNTTGIYPATLN